MVNDGLEVNNVLDVFGLELQCKAAMNNQDNWQ